MASNSKLYEKAMDLLRGFARFKENGSPAKDELLSDKRVHFALAILQDLSGILRVDRKLANLCADCFMLGVYITSKKNGTHISEDEQARRCLQCDLITSKNGMFRCRLQKCKYE